MFKNPYKANTNSIFAEYKTVEEVGNTYVTEYQEPLHMGPAEPQNSNKAPAKPYHKWNTFSERTWECLSFVKDWGNRMNPWKKVLTYFGVGRISWPFLYHFNSTVGSARSTINRTFPPLSTWYAGSNLLAKAIRNSKVIKLHSVEQFWNSVH